MKERTEYAVVCLAVAAAFAGGMWVSDRIGSALYAAALGAAWGSFAVFELARWRERRRLDEQEREFIAWMDEARRARDLQCQRIEQLLVDAREAGIVEEGDRRVLQ